MAAPTSTNTKQLRWQGARYASLSAVIGCIVFTLVDTFPFLVDEYSLMVTVTIALAVLASLFSLPFAIAGGYTLGWFLQKMKWHKQDSTKAAISGMAIAGITIVVIFMVGGSIQACIVSHGQCEGDIIGYTKQLVLAELEQGFLTDAGLLLMSRFLKALPIAAAGGGITGWRLARSIGVLLGTTDAS